jgi:hypothetical protein
MGQTREIVKVFLASPGDLSEERNVAKAVVDEINTQWSEVTGHQIDLVGWEDTVSVWGRPQATINRELERCEIFVGMMWKKWGTSPDTSGQFTSGFEEEYETSVARREREGRPEISLFLKQIATEFLVDPGEDLKKVQAFQSKLIAEKKILYEQFTDPRDFEKKLRRCLSKHLIDRWELQNSAKLKEQAAPSTVVEADLPGISDQEPKLRLLSEEGATFAREFIRKTEIAEKPTSLDSVEIARFRLLATLVGGSANDELWLGAHDANLIYRFQDRIPLGHREESGLLNAGLSHYRNENVPLWKWVERAGTDLDFPILSLSSLSTTSDVRRTGALDAMRLISEPLPPESILKRQHILQSWLLTDSATTRNAALKYLADCGIAEDIPRIREEFDKNNTQTNSDAAEAIVKISLRESAEKGLRAICDLQPLTISESTISALFQKASALNTDTLLLAANHANSSVRRESLKILVERKALPIERAELLLENEDSEVRYQALLSLIDSGRSVTEEAARKVLVKPAKGALPFGIFGRLEGQEQHDRFKLTRLRAMPLRALETIADGEDVLDLEASFVLDERRFAARRDSLREAIADQFQGRFAQYLTKVSELNRGDDALITKAQEISEFTRKRLTRGALDVVSRKLQLADLALVRSTLKTDFVQVTIYDIEFLRRFGEWDDIALLVGCFARLQSGGLAYSLLSTPDESILRATARAIGTLGKHRFSELIRVKMSSRLLCYVTANAPNADIRRLTNKEIERLLTRADDSVRKVIALKCICALSKARLASLLQAYFERDDKQFYNVIHWLDFGLSVSRDQTLAAAEKLLKQQWPSR